LKNILAKNEGKVRVVLKHMVVHPQQVTAAHLAACAAAKQGKFAQFYSAFWDKGFGPYRDSGGKEQASLGPENVKKIAGELGLDTAKLEADMAPCQQVIQQDEAELRKFKVSGTPAFFINGQFIGGGIPEEAFQKVIDEKLKIAEASGVPGKEYYDKEILGKGEKEVVRRRPGR